MTTNQSADMNTAVPNATLRAASYAGVGAFMLASMSLFAKVLGDTTGPIEVTFLRNAVGLVFLLVFFALTGQMSAAKTARPWAHVTRSALGTFGIVLGMWAYIVLPLGIATVFFFTMPLYTVILSPLLLKEKVGWRRIAAVLVGFGGILVMALPELNGDISPLGLALGLSYPFVAALVDICLRWMGRSENPMTTVFYFLFLGSLMLAVFLPFTGQRLIPDMRSYDMPLIIAALGASGAFFQVMKTRALQLAPVYVTGPMTYTMIFWAISFDWLIWDKAPGWNVLAGAAIIIASNAFILWREYTLGKDGSAA